LLRTWSPQLKIIAICGGSLASNHDLLHRATELGASAVMCKPFDADQLVETVTNCLDVERSLEIPIPLAAADLMQAIAEDQLFLEYLPALDFRLERITGVEALVRWRHPEHGIIRPDKFIALAEESALIHHVTDWVVASAARQVAEWHADNLDLAVSVNISARDATDADLPERLCGYCRDAEIAHASMTLELSENAAMRVAIEGNSVLQQLRLLGFGLSVDDFGTGISSRLELTGTPFTEVKIDRFFTATMASSHESWIAVETMVDVARNLDLGCVAEGVENAATLDALREIGCSAAQGYFLSRPLPADQIAQVTRRYSPGKRRQ
jgi:EAL domain-containing protein (putative c-di-GMP-specific phosphodiesterase class I)